jgi:catechol 1,2-dioxygenase
MDESQPGGSLPGGSLPTPTPTPGSNATGPRVAELVDALTGALADVVRRHGVTEQEWYDTLAYLGEVAAADQLILLSDVLGLSVLVDRQAHGERPGTASNVLGPFWRPAPELSNPAELVDEDQPGERLVVTGVVRSAAAGAPPLPGARLDVWQCDAHGLYDVQVGDGSAVGHRGVLCTDDVGAYELRTIVPPPYEVPKDGPVGALLAALGRHAFRPAHIHFKVGAPGHHELTTMVFFAGDPWLGDDAIGADRPELTAAIDRTGPTATTTFDITLAPTGATST